MDFILRSWREEDAPDLAAAADDPGIARWLRNAFPNPYTLEDAKAFIGFCLTQTAGQLLYAIEVQGHAAGGISMQPQQDVYQRSAELGYWLARPYWGHGIATQAVQRICRQAFDCFDIARIYAEPFAENAASRRVLEKAGFTCEGTLRQSVYKNGRLQDSCMYALLRENG